MTRPYLYVVFFVCLALAIGFLMAQNREHPLVPAAMSVVVRWTLEAAAATAILRWSRGRNWHPGHYLAIATATTLAYTIFGLTALLRGHTNLGEPTNAFEIAGQVVLAALVFLAIRRGATRPPLMNH